MSQAREAQSSGEYALDPAVFKSETFALPLHSQVPFDIVNAANSVLKQHTQINSWQ
jgi:hypothetical protein